MKHLKELAIRNQHEYIIDRSVFKVVNCNKLELPYRSILSLRVILNKELKYKANSELELKRKINAISSEIIFCIRKGSVVSIEVRRHKTWEHVQAGPDDVDLVVLPDDDQLAQGLVRQLPLIVLLVEWLHCVHLQLLLGFLLRHFKVVVNVLSHQLTWRNPFFFEFFVLDKCHFLDYKLLHPLYLLEIF